MYGVIVKDLELVKFDGVTCTAIYEGGMTDLIPKSAVWRIEDWGEFGKIEVLKLSEIADQFPNRLITVICESPINGHIYQYGNYNDGRWRLIGETMGYV